jgi:Mg/Co/Ni transporter MgtE
MKGLTRELLLIYAIGLIVSPMAGALTYSFTDSWELGAVVGIVLFACFVRASSSSYFAFRGNPEYQKDVNDKR